MAVKYLKDFRAAKPEVVQNAFSEALYLLHDEIKDDCNFYAKRDTNTMRLSCYVEVDEMELSVIWDTPYAKAAWSKGKPRKDKNPHAELRWAEVAEHNHSAKWRKQLEKAMVEVLKNGTV